MASGTTACIGYANLFSAAAVSASSQLILAPASNLQQPDVTANLWRSVESGTANIVADFGSSVSIDTIAVMGLTLSAAGSVRFRLSTLDSSGAAGDAYDSGSLPTSTVYNQVVDLLTSPASARYLRMDLTDAGADYVEAGRVFAGVSTQFTVNFAYNWTVTRTDRSIVTKTRGGQTQIFRDIIYRTLAVTFEFLSEAERYGIVETIDLTNGLQDDILFIIDPTSTNLSRDSFWGLMTELSPITQANFDIFSKSYKLEERR